MEVKAFSKSVQVAPRKVRLVADAVRKLSVDNALVSLISLKKRGAGVLEKTLRSAIANAIDRKLQRESLFIKSIDVVEGPAYKRFHHSTRGRVHPYKKRTTHIRIILSDDVIVQKRKSGKAGSRSAGEVKQDGTKS